MYRLIDIDLCDGLKFKNRWFSMKSDEEFWKIEQRRGRKWNKERTCEKEGERRCAEEKEKEKYKMWVRRRKKDYIKTSEKEKWGNNIRVKRWMRIKRRICER